MSARRAWAWPLVPVYAALIGTQAWMYRVGLLTTRRLRWPVVSVGSLSAGGAGKTPVVIALAKLLKDRGWEVDVLSRGYGRSGTEIAQVEPEALDAAARFGDEPVSIARQAGVPVWVGADRYEAGQRAQAAARGGWRSLHLLDDGMQHRQLARALELVLVTREDLEDASLPAGNLRERLGALSRADAVLVREDEFDSVGTNVWELVWVGTPIWTLRRWLHFPAPLHAQGAGARPLAFCAIARPAGFTKMLLEARCAVVDTVTFDDHHPYAMEDIETLVAQATEHNATGFVTTDKDAVKLTPAMRERLESVGPLMVATLEVEFANTYEVMRAIEARLA